MNQELNVLADRGSKYAVSGGMADSSAEAKAFVKKLTRNKKFLKATHNTWAIVYANGSQQKQDDGESGAAAIILRMLEREQLFNHIVVVSRWYGGVHLGADRFRHVKNCVDTYLNRFVRQ